MNRIPLLVLLVLVNLPLIDAARDPDGSLPTSLLVVTLVLDVLLLALWWRLSRRGGRLRPTLELAADTDVEPVEGEDPRPALTQVRPGLHEAVGEVVTTVEGLCVLHLGNRHLRVRLGAHANRVPVGRPARVTGRIVG